MNHKINVYMPSILTLCSLKLVSILTCEGKCEVATPNCLYLLSLNIRTVVESEILHIRCRLPRRCDFICLIFASIIIDGTPEVDLVSTWPKKMQILFTNRRCIATNCGLWRGSQLGEIRPILRGAD